MAKVIAAGAAVVLGGAMWYVATIGVAYSCVLFH